MARNIDDSNMDSGVIGQVGKSQLNGNSPFLLILQPVRIRPCKGLYETCLAVIHMTVPAEFHLLLDRHGIRHRRYQYSKLLPVIDPDWYLLRHPAPAAVYRHVYQWGLYRLLPHTAPDSSRYRGRRHDTGDYDADGAQLSLRDAQPELCPAGCKNSHTGCTVTA